MNKQEENLLIEDAIDFFTLGKFSEVRPFLEKLITNEGVSYNGFTFNRDAWCWIVWKPTDINRDPQYKGDPLYKVIPRNASDISKVLDAQPWTYS